MKSDKLFALCSGGDKHPAGQALSSHLLHLVTRIKTLESHGNSSGGLGSGVLPSLSSSSTSQCDALAASITLIKRDITGISYRIGQKVVDLFGEKLNLSLRLFLG